MDDPSQFTIPKAVIEGFESHELCHNLGAHLSASAWRPQRCLVGQEPAHAVVLKASGEATHRIRVEVWFLGPLRGRNVGKED